MIWDSDGKKVIQHLIGFIIMVCIVYNTTISVANYDLNYEHIWGIIAYAMLFVGMPVFSLMICWKKRPLRWYILLGTMVALLSVSRNFLFNMEEVDTTISNYTEKTTEFHKAAARYLPDNGDILDAENIDYIHRTKKNQGIEYIYMCLSYESAIYEQTTEKILAHILKADENDTTNTEPVFMLYGHRFHSRLLFINGKYYAVACATSADSRTLSIYFITDPWLSSVSIRDTLVKAQQ